MGLAPALGHGLGAGQRPLLEAAVPQQLGQQRIRAGGARRRKRAAEQIGRIELDGQAGRITYALAEFPDRDFTVALWVCVTALPKTNYGQVFSAWCKGMDDPLRLVVHQGKLHARIEAGQFFGTEGWPVEVGKWTHVAAVKEGTKLTLYINGAAHSTAKVPESVVSSAEDFALGGNPHFGGPEFLACRLADLRFFARALSADEVRARTK